MKKRMNATERKNAILEAALALSVRIGYRKLTRDNVAKAAGVSGPTIMHRFGTIRCLQNRVMMLAIKRGVGPVIVQGLAIKDPLAMKIPKPRQQEILRDWGRTL